jgi:two-component system LytT family sensor kinase
MKIRWKYHELLFATMSTAVIIAGYIGQSKTPLDTPFIQNHVPFNSFRNVLGPKIGMTLIIYLVYLFINSYTIPRFQFPVRITVRKFLWLLFQFLFIGLILGSALNGSVYFQHEWQFHYPGFSIWFNANNPNSQINLFAGYAGVFFLLIFYFLYAGLRQLVIRYIDRAADRRLYRIMITNQVTGFLTFLSIILVILSVIESASRANIDVYFLSFALPGFVLFMTSTYWLFPLKGKNSFLNLPLITRLLIWSVVLILPFSLIIIKSIPGPNSITGPAFLYLLAWQLFIVTPASWLLYRQRKDTISELRGLERALVKSKADLHFLRSQINPHFLFNTLNTLYGTALQEGASNTSSGIQKLGDMMRFMLHDNTRDFIQMNSEIEYLKNYISFQKLRTQSSDKITVEDNIEEQNCQHQIAPMMLIPMVENAFKHGISLKKKSWIKIKLKCNEKEIRFEVRNSIHPGHINDSEKEKSGIGLKNVTERLKLIYPEKHEITVHADEKEFFVQLLIIT